MQGAPPTPPISPTPSAPLLPDPERKLLPEVRTPELTDEHFSFLETMIPEQRQAAFFEAFRYFETKELEIARTDAGKSLYEVDILAAITRIEAERAMEEKPQ